jgi:hypothetical protein
MTCTGAYANPFDLAFVGSSSPTPSSPLIQCKASERFVLKRDLQITTQDQGSMPGLGEIGFQVRNTFIHIDSDENWLAEKTQARQVQSCPGCEVGRLSEVFQDTPENSPRLSEVPNSLAQSSSFFGAYTFWPGTPEYAFTQERYPLTHYGSECTRRTPLNSSAREWIPASGRMPVDNCSDPSNHGGEALTSQVFVSQALCTQPVPLHPFTLIDSLQRNTCSLGSHEPHVSSLEQPLSTSDASELTDPAPLKTFQHVDLHSGQLPSLGSALHSSGLCKPCAFLHTKGCENQTTCSFCHLCEPGEKKRRQKHKRASLRRTAWES